MVENGSIGGNNLYICIANVHVEDQRALLRLEVYFAHTPVGSTLSGQYRCFKTDGGLIKQMSPII